MPRQLRNALIVAVVFALAALSVFPPEKKLRLGKDLSGGVSLVYAVQLDPSESPDQVIPAIIETLKLRVDPDGTSDISMTRQGRDRIEITLPLPSERVKGLKKAYQDALAALGTQALDTSAFERAMRLQGAEREAEIARLAGSDDQQKTLLTEAAAASDAAAAARERYDAARKELDDARAAGAEQAKIDELSKKVDEATGGVAQAEVAYDAARDKVLRSTVTSEEVRRAMERPRRSRALFDAETNTAVAMPSPRDEAIKRLKERYPGAASRIDEVDRLHQAYLAERRSLDDPADLKRLLSGAGVLDFRITVDPGDLTDEQDLRRQLRERGPRAARHPQVAWFKINKLEGWYDDVQSLRALLDDPAGFFDARGYVVEEHDGEYWMLCWTTADSRLTRAEGQWRVAGANQTTDDVGKPAIGFQMDVPGGMLLSRLTGNHVGDKMAVLLDDQVYTAPVLRGRIGKSGIIQGDFPPEEINYIQRTLRAGSLHAKLSPDPISEVVVGPDFGIDNLNAGLTAGVYSFLICAAFMVGYYFFCGLIAVIALMLNCLLLLGVMGLVGAAFTLPGIAGVILAFAMAVDANVLIYERMREETQKGADLKTAVRLGYQRALSAIVDGNMTHLIVCTVLYFVGTAEIRGFALTMSIGVGTTLFTQLFVTRLLFDVFVEKLGWRRTTMLPMAVPAVQRAMTLHVDWMRLRPVLYTIFALLVGLALTVIVVRWRGMLDTEFVGGTEVTLKLRDAEGNPKTLTRQEVAERVAQAAETDPGLADMRRADVVVVDPQADGVTSDTFKIKTLVPDSRAVQGAIGQVFKGLIGSQDQLTFARADAEDGRAAPVYAIISATLGDNIDRPGVRDNVEPFSGGVAIVLEGIQPPQSLRALRERIDAVRSQPDFQATLGRRHEVLALEGTDQAVTTAVVLAVDPELSYLSDEQRWGAEMRDVEWRLVRDALTRPTMFLSAQSFSAAIAATFAAQAIGAVLLSAVVIVIFIWVRFNSMRFSFAAIVPTLLDCVTAVGLIAMAEIICDAAPAFARAMSLEPFKLDLTVVASLLTILGYSINDKIVVLDRIRENRGKLPYVTREIVNTSVNQTMSRTLMTGTTTILSTVVLYIVGGEGVRAFAYALGLGAIIGTFSSIALGAPLVWSRREEERAKHKPPGPGSSASAPKEMPRQPLATAR